MVVNLCELVMLYTFVTMDSLSVTITKNRNTHERVSTIYTTTRGSIHHMYVRECLGKLFLEEQNRILPMAVNLGEFVLWYTFATHDGLTQLDHYWKSKYPWECPPYIRERVSMRVVLGRRNLTFVDGGQSAWVRPVIYIYHTWWTCPACGWPKVEIPMRECLPKIDFCLEVIFDVWFLRYFSLWDARC